MPHTIEETRDGRLLLVKLGPLGPVSNNAYIVADTTTNDAGRVGGSSIRDTAQNAALRIASAEQRTVAATKPLRTTSAHKPWRASTAIEWSARISGVTAGRGPTGRR